MDLGEEWEKHRAPLVASLRAKRDFASQRRARARAKVEEMKRCRAEMQAMASDVRAKEEQVGGWVAGWVVAGKLGGWEAGWLESWVAGKLGGSGGCGVGG